MPAVVIATTFVKPETATGVELPYGAPLVTVPLPSRPWLLAHPARGRAVRQDGALFLGAGGEGDDVVQPLHRSGRRHRVYGVGVCAIANLTVNVVPQAVDRAIGKKRADVALPRLDRGDALERKRYGRAGASPARRLAPAVRGPVDERGAGVVATGADGRDVAQIQHRLDRGGIDRGAIA